MTSGCARRATSIVAGRDVTGGAAGRGEHRGPAVVNDLQAQLILPVVDHDPAVRGGGVLDHVGERLLDDTEGGQVDPSRHVTALTAHPQVDMHPGVPDPGDQAVQVSQPWSGPQRCPRRPLAAHGRLGAR